MAVKTATISGRSSYSSTSWVVWPKEILDDTQIKQLKELLLLATRDDAALTELASSIAEVAGVTTREAQKMLMILRCLLQLAQLQETLQR